MQKDCKPQFVNNFQILFHKVNIIRNPKLFEISKNPDIIGKKIKYSHYYLCLLNYLPEGKIEELYCMKTNEKYYVIE